MGCPAILVERDGVSGIWRVRWLQCSERPNYVLARSIRGLEYNSSPHAELRVRSLSAILVEQDGVSGIWRARWLECDERWNCVLARSIEVQENFLNLARAEVGKRAAAQARGRIVCSLGLAIMVARDGVSGLWRVRVLQRGERPNCVSRSRWARPLWSNNAAGS